MLLALGAAQAQPVTGGLSPVASPQTSEQATAVQSASSAPDTQNPPLALAQGPVTAPGTPASQTTSARIQDVCAIPRTFVDTSINGSGRGGSLLLSREGENWVNADLLKPSEAAYAAETVTCPDATFVRLSPLLDVNYDPGELTLEVRTRLDLLPGNILDLTPSKRSATPSGAVLPVTTFGAHVYAERQPGFSDGEPNSGASSSLAQSLTLSAGYQVARAALSVVAGESGLLADPRLGVSARGLYDLSDDLALGAGVYGVSESGSGRRFGFSDQQISGLEARLGSARAYRIPSLTFELPLDSDILVSVNGEAGQRFRARAGLLTLKNVPVASPSGSVIVEVRDASGTRRLERLYQVSDVTVSARSAAALAHVGVIGQSVLDPAGNGMTMPTFSPAADLTGVYGLSENWSVAGQFLLSRPATRGQFSVRYADAVLSAGAAADYDSARLNRFLLVTDAAYTVQTWRVGAALSLPVSDLSQTQLALQAGYSAGRSTFTVRAQAIPGLSSYDLSAGLTQQVNDAFTVSGDVGYSVSAASGSVWRAGLRLVWTPTPLLSVQAQAGIVGGGTAGTNAADDGTGTNNGTAANSGPALSAATQVAYQFAPGQVVSGTLGYSAGQAVGAAQYSVNRDYAATLGASTLGDLYLDADVGVSLVGGRAYVNRSEPGPGVLIHTGVPNLALLVGTQSVTTDASGDALVLLGEGVRVVSVLPDFDHIPLTITVQEDQRDLTLAPHGVVTLDWKDNFMQSQWLHLFWPDGKPVAYGSVSLQATGQSSQTYTSDDQGWVLLPKLPAATQLDITEDPDAGTRRCTASATLGSDAVTCTLSP